MSVKYAYDRTYKPPRGESVHRLMFMLLSSWQSMGFIRTASKMLAALVMFVFTWAWNARLFLFWFFSPRVSDFDFEIRQGICNNCDKLTREEDGTRWCGACGCPKWKYSELTIKNEYAGHNCPLGKHPGSVALPVINQSGGCTNCGDKT